MDRLSFLGPGLLIRRAIQATPHIMSALQRTVRSSKRIEFHSPIVYFSIRNIWTHSFSFSSIAALRLYHCGRLRARPHRFHVHSRNCTKRTQFTEEIEKNKLDIQMIQSELNYSTTLQKEKKTYAKNKKLSKKTKHSWTTTLRNPSHEVLSPHAISLSTAHCFAVTTGYITVY